MGILYPFSTPWGLDGVLQPIFTSLHRDLHSPMGILYSFPPHEGQTVIYSPYSLLYLVGDLHSPMGILYLFSTPWGLDSVLQSIFTSLPSLRVTLTYECIVSLLHPMRVRRCFIQSTFTSLASLRFTLTYGYIVSLLHPIRVRWCFTILIHLFT